MIHEAQPYLAVRIDPDDMVQYVHDLMNLPSGRTDAVDSSAVAARRQWGGDQARARAAQLRWTALTRAFGDERVSTWTTPQRQDRLHVPAALIAAAGVATLQVAQDEVVFDIPTLLDATLELCEAVGHG